jgi:tetratricopeptide (TPR) repeat protein
LDEAVRLNPDDLDIIASKGLLLCDVAEYHAAIELMQPYSKGMRHPWANCVLGWAYENGSNSASNSQAKEYAQKALLAYEAGLPDPTVDLTRFTELDLWNWKGKGNALRLLGRIEDANAAYRKVLELAKKHPVRVSADIHALLGWCEYGVCNFVEAVRLLQSAVSLDPSLLGTAFDLGLALFCCSQLAVAVERYTYALDAVEAKEIEGRRGFLYVAWFDLQEAIQDSRIEALDENVPEVKQVTARLRASLETAFAGTSTAIGLPYQA